MGDRLAEIKAGQQFHTTQLHSQELLALAGDDVRWLIAEVERLEAHIKELESRDDWKHKGGPILHLPGGDKRGD